MEDAEQVIADALAGGMPASYNVIARSIANSLRSTGLLPGPDDIVVSREALEAITTASSRERLEWAFDVIDAALSQPHP